jgi:hypothetical protein
MTVAGHRRTRRRAEPAPVIPPPPGKPQDGRGGTIRRRLVGILALPLVAVLVLLGVVSTTELRDYRISTDTTRAVTLALSVQDLVQELQTERGLVAGLLGGNVGFRDELTPARERVDSQRTAVDRLAAGGGALETRVRAALHELDGLAAVRAGTIAGGTGSRGAAFQFYTDRIATLNGLDFGLDSAADLQLRRAVAVLTALSRLRESTAQERAFLNGVFSAGGFAEGEFVQFAGMRAAKEVALADFGQQATAEQKAANAYVLDTGAAREAAFFEQVALKAADGRRLQVNPQSWWSALTTVLDDMLRMQRYVGSQIQIRAQTLQTESTRRVGVLSGMALLCFAGAIALLTVASRSITRPLAVLAAEAHSVATERLPAGVVRAQGGDGEQRPVPPEPVRVPARSTAEIRSVAAALDRVQAVAFSLATEQAMLRRSTSESLANLGRRNQNLLRRQLGFITTLEQQENDPAGLANLFELDHLATRMRRNAESLLVLVGASNPYRPAQPLAVSDVIRAAISEVEEYRRVTLRRIDDAFVGGAAASGIAHMLAELVENGLTFSPPDVDVEVQGRRLGDGYLIAITDQGVGMGTEDLAAANARLRGEGDFVSAPARYLGHYVVGRLATELGVDVQLAPSPVTGITARVKLPLSLLAVPPAVASVDAEEVAEPATPAVAAPMRRVPSEVGPATPLQPAAGGVAIASRPGPSVEFITVPAQPVAATATATDTQPVVASVADAQPEHNGEWTPNGLRKRPPRAQRNAASQAEAGGRPAAAAPDETAALDDSPSEVRARLQALRAGMRRGEQERGTP